MRGKTQHDSLAEIRVDGGRASACGTPLLKGEAPAVEGMWQREMEERRKGKVLATTAATGWQASEERLAAEELATTTAAAMRAVTARQDRAAAK